MMPQQSDYNLYRLWQRHAMFSTTGLVYTAEMVDKLLDMVLGSIRLK